MLDIFAKPSLHAATMHEQDESAGLRSSTVEGNAKSSIDHKDLDEEAGTAPGPWLVGTAGDAP
jgi:hypothetical protein